MTKSTISLLEKQQAIFTISDADYASMSLTMFSSVRNFYPDTSLFLFVIGTGQSSVLEDDIHVIYIADIMDDLDFSQRLVHYLQVELTTSVRPQCFNYLFDKGFDRAIYLDPDIYVFRRMHEVDRLLDEGKNGVVTPHALQSSGSANVFGGDNVFLQCGIFNLGFLALRASAETNRMLAWWHQKLKWQCVVDWPNGYFVDQKWLEFLPVYFDDFHILKLPTYNLAPWNSEHYVVTTDDRGTFFLEGFSEPIAFIHFSGVKRSEDHFKHMRSAYQFYKKELAKNRFTKLDFSNYKMVYRPSSLPLDRICTSLYKDYVKLTDDRSSNPLEDRGFYEYLTSTDNETKLPIYIRKLYETMPDIFVGYLDTKQQINFKSLISLMKSGFSYGGVASLRTMERLRRISLNHDLPALQEIKLATGSSYYPAVYAVASISAENICTSIQQKVEIIDRADGTLIKYGQVTVGLPRVSRSGALSKQFVDELETLTEIWLPSLACKQRVEEKYGAQNLAVIPHNVLPPSFEVLPTHLSQTKLTVLFRQDASADLLGRNTRACLGAFKRAFPQEDDVQLVCYLVGSENQMEQLGWLPEFLEEKRAILVREESSRHLLHNLLHHAHCVMSLHEDDVFNAMLAEAMSLGKYIIVNKAEGGTDYLNSDNSFVIDSASMADSLHTASSFLVSIYTSLDFLNKKSKRAKLDAQMHLAPEVVGLEMQKRLQELASRSVNSNPKTSVLNRIARRLSRSLRFRLRRIPAFVAIYMTMKRATRGTSNLDQEKVEQEKNEMRRVIAILLKNANRPAILE